MADSELMSWSLLRMFFVRGFSAILCAKVVGGPPVTSVA